MPRGARFLYKGLLFRSLTGEDRDDSRHWMGRVPEDGRLIGACTCYVFTCHLDPFSYDTLKARNFSLAKETFSNHARRWRFDIENIRLWTSHWCWWFGAHVITSLHHVRGPFLKSTFLKCVQTLEDPGMIHTFACMVQWKWKIFMEGPSFQLYEIGRMIR